MRSTAACEFAAVGWALVATAFVFYCQAFRRLFRALASPALVRVVVPMAFVCHSAAFESVAVAWVVVKVVVV